MKSLYTMCIAILIITCGWGCASSEKNNLNEQASVLPMDQLPENPLLLRPLTSSIDPNNHTMATLYGNDLAFNYASTSNGTDYPAGATLYEVTWIQKPDSVWFGGNMPKAVLSIERIVFGDSKIPAYVFYKGAAQVEKAQIDNAEERTKYIVSQKMAVTP